MQQVGYAKQAAYVAGSGLSPEPADGDEVVSVPAVFPAALFGDGLEDWGGGAPALFGGLRQVAGGQFLLGLGQEPLAGLLIRRVVMVNLRVFSQVAKCGALGVRRAS